MRESTALATQFPSNDEEAFDLDMFASCKRYLSLKDELIVSSVVQSVLGAIDEHQTTVRILDVGTGEASLIGKVCRRLSDRLYSVENRQSKIVVDCIEPCSEGIEFIQRQATTLSSSGVTLQPRNTTIESYFNGSDSTYDAIVCCHMLYHISYEKWDYVLRRLVSKVRPDGVLAVNLVSRRSDIYRIRDALAATNGFVSLTKMYGTYGFDYYAEDLQRLVSQLGVGWHDEIISADIKFSSEDVYDAREELLGRARGSLLLQFLAFMFRLRRDDLLRCGKAKLLSVLVPDSQGITFRSIDRMFLFRGHKK